MTPVVPRAVTRELQELTDSSVALSEPDQIPTTFTPVEYLPRMSLKLPLLLSLLTFAV